VMCLNAVAIEWPNLIAGFTQSNSPQDNK